MRDFHEQLIFGEALPAGVAERTYDRDKVWYRFKGARFWYSVDYLQCPVGPCGGCGRYFSVDKLHCATWPITSPLKMSRDPLNWAHRQVCRGCANRHDGLHRRWHTYRQTRALINGLEKEIANVRRRQAS